MPTFLNNRYILHESLGQGAMGIVYRATDRLSGDVVAIKRVTIPGEDLQFASRSNAKTSEDIKLALAQEFQTLASLRHPHIISVVDYGFDEQRQPFFTMNYLPEAQTVIEASQILDERGKADLLIRILQALAYLHRRNILHRDLKPANVLVTQSGVRVLDFGLSVSREQARGRTGTLAYMAPEVLRSGQACEASDLYAVGVIAYQMFAGELPFQALDIMGILSRPPDLQKLEASAMLAEVIGKLLQKSPPDRFRGAFETIVAINAAIANPLPEEDSAIRESFLQAAKFIGREAELARLLASLDQAQQGHGSVWLVGGESGVGKTRLIKELRIRSLVQGANVLRGQAVADKGQPYQLWQEPLRRLALWGQMNDLQAAVLKSIVPDIETLLERFVPDAPELDDKEAAQRLYLTMSEVIRNGCLAAPPLVLFLEDLHWELESLNALTVINRIAGDLPILVIGTYRTEEAPDLPDKLPGINQLTLTRFDPQAIAELSASMLGDLGVQPQVLSLLQDETEGNVFFLVETVRALAEEAGSLQNVGSSTLPQAVFAGGVQQVIQRRLEQVPEQFRPLLKLAAVAGRALELELLQFTDPEINLEIWLTTCANVAVLEIQDERWRFSHDKLREALLAKLPPDERKLLHNQVAQAIEAIYTDDLALQYGRLANHHAAAGNIQKEQTFAKLAGEQSSAQYANDEALQYFEQALRLTPETDSITQFELLLARGDIFALQGKLEPQLETLKALNKISPQLGDDSKEAILRLRWAQNYYDRSDYPAAIENSQQALQRAFQAGDPKIALQSYNMLAGAFWKHSNLDAAHETAALGLDFARKIADIKSEAELLNNLGMITFEKRDLPAARSCFEQSFQLAQKGGYAHLQARCLNSLGMAAGYQGDFVAAQSYYKQALEIAQKMGARKYEAMNLGNLGWVSGLLGDFENAIRYTKENIRIAREIGNLYNETYGLINLSSYAGARGDLATALQSAMRAREFAQEIGDRSAEAWALTSLGHCYLASRDFEQAAEAYQRAMAIRQALNQPLLATEPAAGLARTCLEQGDFSRADQHIQAILPILKKHKGLDGTDDPFRVYLACYLVLKANHSSETDGILKTAYELIQSRAAQIPDPDSQKSFLENIPHHREIRMAWEKYQTEISRGNLASEGSLL